MSEEEIRKILNNEIKKEIKLNLDSALIFTYVQALEKEIEELKEKQDYARLEKEQLLEDVKEYYISKDKIREIIDKSFPDVAIQKITELLGE